MRPPDNGGGRAGAPTPAPQFTISTLRTNNAGHSCDQAVRRIAQRFALSLPMAAMIAELALIGGAA